MHVQLGGIQRRFAVISTKNVYEYHFLWDTVYINDFSPSLKTMITINSSSSSSSSSSGSSSSKITDMNMST